MHSLLFTSCCCFDSLYGLSHDETKYQDRKSSEILAFVNQTSLQMVTSSMTHCQYFHVIFHVLLLILAVVMFEMRLEPPNVCLTDRRLNQLSLRVFLACVFLACINKIYKYGHAWVI